MFRRSVMLIGNFDGLHRGHQLLFAQARQLADDHDADVVAVTFLQHPIAVLRPAEVPPVIAHRNQRTELLTAAGADHIDWLDPTPGLLALSAEAFVRQMVEKHHPMAIVEGENFRFGHRRAGNIQSLRDIGEQLDFQVHAAELVIATLRDKLQVKVSSSLIRWLIGHGRVADAALCLGRPWALRGDVVAGDQRGRTIGIPTANLDTTPQMLPADGVYAADTLINSRRYLAAVSVGTKPTFEGNIRTCEAHLIDYTGDLYGQSLTLHMHRWLRDQWRFGSVDQLLAQIHTDILRLREYDQQQLLSAATLSS